MSENGHPTEYISSWVDNHIKKLMKILPSYLRDSNHLLDHLAPLQPQNNDKIYSLDVVSLYTNIPHSDGVGQSYQYEEDIWAKPATSRIM